MSGVGSREQTGNKQPIMTTTKVSLTIALPGSVMFSKQLCFKNSTIKDKNGKTVNVETPVEGMTNQESFTLKLKDKKTGNMYTKRYDYHVRKCIPAKQVINISEEAYRAMIENEIPDFFRMAGVSRKQLPALWQSLTDSEKLMIHFDAIAADLGGEVVDYEIFPDDEDLD